MAFKIPQEWIEKWITKGGHRIPILKKEYRKSFLWTLSFTRKSPLHLVDSRTVNDVLDKAGFETLDFLEFPAAPHSRVQKGVLPQIHALLSIFKGTSYEEPFRRLNLTFYRFASPGAPFGLYSDADVLATTGRLERALTKRFFEQFSALEQMWIGLSLGIKVPELYASSPEARKLAKLVFPENSGVVCLSVLPSTKRFDYGYIFLHECGHFVQSRFSARFPKQYVDFGPSVYAPYIKRVLPECISLFEEGMERYENKPSSTVRNFVRVRLLRLLHTDPSKTAVLTTHSLWDPEEGFSDAFAYYANADLEKRRLLKLKWPEAYDFFDTWLRR